MLIFKLDAIQLVLIAAFVEVCGGVAVDVMFGRRLAYLAKLPKNKVRAFQLLGLVISCLSIGIIVWLFATHLGIGSAELTAVKARNRYLLLNAHHFNYYVLAIGALFGLVLSFTKINASFVLGGILMPFDISLGLIAGGALSLLSKDRERWFPIWSGAFAAQSVWILFRALVG
jgi:hypothetical protein